MNLCVFGSLADTESQEEEYSQSDVQTHVRSIRYVSSTSSVIISVSELLMIICVCVRAGL